MKKRLLFIFLCCVYGAIQAQQPVSWENTTLNTPDVIVLPPLDLEAIQQEDAINDLDKSQPWRYGIERSISINLLDNGTWTDVPEAGGRIWQAAIKTPNAINVSVNFDNFYLPPGARLQLFNEDRTDMTKLYSSGENRANNTLASWFVEGDLIYIEYFEPYTVVETAQLSIGSIIHGYRLGNITQFIETTRGLNDSGDCNQDVNCDTGEDFEAYKTIVKKAVALLTLGNGYLCSAVMLNNTSGDKKPYLLTANHCLQNSNPALWSVRFNWVSPNPVCATEDDSVDLQTNFTMSGATLRANNAQSDFALVELVNRVPSSWDMVFAGWDATDALPDFEVGIHHPKGDIMKVCRDDDGAVKENANGVDVWLIGGQSIGTGNGWEIGTTESGSSGSPLFNEQGKIIGQLYAGQSQCIGTTTNNDYDIYGRFAISWDAGDTPETRLKDWLDPSNTGIVSLDALQNSLGVPDNQQVGVLQIFPNPATTHIEVTNSRYPNLIYNFYNAMGQKLMGGSMANTDNRIDLSHCASGIYFLQLVDETSKQEITKKIIVAK